jgi:hypothetical protein
VTTFLLFSLALLLSNLATALLVTASMLHRHRHKHRWEGWTPWLQDAGYNGVRVLRYRTCRGCAEVERQAAGLHQCHIAVWHGTKECPHLKVLTAPPLHDRIAGLERELGIDGE